MTLQAVAGVRDKEAWEKYPETHFVEDFLNWKKKEKILLVSR